MQRDYGFLRRVNDGDTGPRRRLDRLQKKRVVGTPENQRPAALPDKRKNILT